MNPGRFYIPGYMGMRGSSISAPLMRMANATPVTGMLNSASRSGGIFSRITNGIRAVNWGNLLNNANKTLNVVNQAIPLVRQAGPMVNNMKSMLRIAKAFGSETTSKNTNRLSNRMNSNNITNSDRNNNFNDISNSYTTEKSMKKEKEVQNDNIPNFFV